MDDNRKVPKTIRLTPSAWNLIDEIGKREMWDRNVTILEMVKNYAKQNNIPFSEAEGD